MNNLQLLEDPMPIDILNWLETIHVFTTVINMIIKVRCLDVKLTSFCVGLRVMVEVLDSACVKRAGAA